MGLGHEALSCEVFASLPAGQLAPPGSSSPGLQLLSRVFNTGACLPPRSPPASDNLPCGSFPFGVFPATGGNSSRERPAPGYPRPSQRFSRSQGLTPPAPCRPCFMPVPPLGFYPSGLFHPRSRTPSRTPLPSCGYPPPGRHANRQVCRLSRSEPTFQAACLTARPHGNRIPLQGLAPRERLHPQPVV